MKYAVLFMMSGFALAGSWMAFAALAELARRLRVLPRLERASGVVVGVRVKSVPGPPAGRLRRPRAHYPVITYSKSDGSTETFESGAGSAGASSHYEPGQTVAVLYDPRGGLAPMPDTWAALWLPPLLMGAAALAFIGASALIYVAFGRRLF